MSSIYGENIHLSIFGQSHSEAIGMTLDGIPAGQKIDIERLNAFLARRAPGNSELSTTRKEADLPEILSGFIDPADHAQDSNTDPAGSGPEGHVKITCGAPIAAIIRNTNTRSKDYSELKTTPRPGHADYTAGIKYHGAQDYAGGGHFSGRLTAPMCIAGGICLQLLEQKGISIFTRIRSIGNIEDDSDFEKYIVSNISSVVGSGQANISGRIRESISHSGLSVIDSERSAQMVQLILDKKAEGDSVGGVIECVVTGLPAGLGDPMFDGMENRIAQAVFAIPAVKGIEFGAGFEASKMCGSENNDCFRINEDHKVITETNNCGGILGGITDGMPLVFKAAFKPTPSIAKEQKSVDLNTLENTTLTVHGRHDPCIVPRALPCVEAAAALAIYDAYLGRMKELQ
ncbi:MAG: chorismate synthase [Lachnospiraceae bacterium]|nr:chorismate synthase [Lachnospiraceae bacterium]